jgi:hypothetical protein
MSDEISAGAVESSTPASDPVESSSLPSEAKDFIRTMDAEAAAVEEVPSPAEPPPATADDDAAPAPLQKPARPEPVRPTLSADQRRLIRDSYIDEADVAEMSPDQVDKMLLVIAKREDKIARAERARQRERDEAGRFKPAPQETPAQVAARHKLPDEYDEDFHKAFNTRDAELDEIKAELAQLKGFTTEQQQVAAAQKQAENVAWFDEQFSKLGDEFVPVLGKGTVRDIDPRSVEFKARDNVVKTAYKLAELFPEADAEELFRKAVSAHYADVFANQHRAQINGQLLKQSGRRLGAGSSVRAPAVDYDPMDPDGKLGQFFNRALQENGSRA